MILNEALASHVPVIASDLGGMPERIKNGFNGFTFIPGDQQDLQAKIEMIINERTLLNTLKNHIATQ